MPRRRIRPELIVDQGRFVSTLTDLSDIRPLPPAAQRSSDIEFDIVKGADVVVIWVEGFGIGLVRGSGPVRRAGDSDGFLAVHFAFQHIAERAIYEEKAKLKGVTEPFKPDVGRKATFTIPEKARPAKRSRLVLTVPAGLEIAFTSDGVLAALSQLPWRSTRLLGPGQRWPGSPMAVSSG